MELVVAEAISRGVKIAVPVKAALTKTLTDNEIDVLPFVKAHRVDENANARMDTVVAVLAEIAEDAKCAVELVQHARKPGGNEIPLYNAGRKLYRRRRPHGTHRQPDDQDRRRADRRRRGPTPLPCPH